MIMIKTSTKLPKCTKSVLLPLTYIEKLSSKTPVTKIKFIGIKSCGTYTFDYS